MVKSGESENAGKPRGRGGVRKWGNEGEESLSAEAGREEVAG